jgi:LCP family protein required for cell wall assembly
VSSPPLGVSEAILATPTQAQLEQTIAPLISPTATTVPVCGGPPTLTILLSGVASEGYLYGLADAIRVVHLDFQHQTISVLALPRDLWVDIPGIADHGISKGKLNQAYFYGTKGMGYFDGSGFGSGLLAETLREDFGLRIDHYLAVNLNAFRKIIDTMGGIDVYFSQPVYVKRFEKPVLYLNAGSQHLSGKQAENVVRTRIDIGDFGRIDHQTVVLKAVAAKLLTPAGYQHLPNLIQTLSSSVLTDLSPAEIGQLVCLAEKIDLQKGIGFYDLPDSLLRESRVYDSYLDYQPYVLLYDERELRQYLASFLNNG